MQLIFNRNRMATEASTAAHWMEVPCEVSALTCQSRRTSLREQFRVTTGAASPTSSADSWSIGFREPRPISARMQSGLSDLGLARWDGHGERDEISIQKRAFFTLYIVHSISTLFLFCTLGSLFFPKISEIFSSSLSFLLHDLLSSGENLSSGKPGSVSTSAFLHSVPVYLSMWVNTLSTPLIPSIIGSVHQRPQCLPGCWQLAEIDSVMLYVRQSDLMTRL